MLENNYNTSASPQGAPSSSSDPFTSSDQNGVNNKRKRKPAGTPGNKIEFFQFYFILGINLKQGF